jgi:hypothetical protein
MPHRRTVLSLAITITLGACAPVALVVAPDAPQPLAPPAGERLTLTAHAAGVQVYECTQRAEGPQWVFRAPEAILEDANGRRIGKHYAGPTWESLDGSRVAGALVASVPAGDASAIPLLLLTAKEHAGTGVFSGVRSIQRLQTVGGRAPSTPCTAAEVGTSARTAYRATYYFYSGA